MSTPKFSARTAHTWLLERPTSLQTLFWFIVILLLKHANLFEPPVWDSAMGVFPPAIYLYENSFDIHGLLQQTAWTEGGPNVHSLSLLTWIIALVMTVTHSPEPTFLIIHLLTFAFFAWALTLFTNTLRSYGLASHTVLAAAALLLLTPLVLVQVGAMYTETLVLCTSIAAWAYYRDGRPGRAVLFCILGIFCKLTAVPIAALIGGALLFSGRPYAPKKIALILCLPLALWINLSLPTWLGAASQAAHVWGEPEHLLFRLRTRLQSVPDVQLLIRLGILCSAAFFIARIWKDRGLAILTHSDSQARSILICLMMPATFMACVYLLMFQNYLFLSRYLVPALPFAIATVLLFARQVRGEKVVFILLLCVCFMNIANHNGQFYLKNYTTFSIIERSHAYRDFHDIQVQAIRALEQKPSEMPAFVSREIHYMISSPMMGYVENTIPDTFPIFNPPYKDRTLEEMPDQFILLQTNSGHGGAEMTRLLLEVQDSQSHEVTTETFEQNRFRANLYLVKRTTS